MKERFMFLHAPSHRAAAKIDRVLGRHPQYYWRIDQKGDNCFLLESEAEIAAAIAIGAKKCRQQNPTLFLKCWQ